MIDFLLILFFSETILLTPEYIDINEIEYRQVLDKPISAITNGASIQVDVTSMFPKIVQNDILQHRETIISKFHNCTISAFVISNNKQVQLDYRGSVIVNRDSARLILSADNIPTSVDFNKFVIKANTELKGVQLYWKNYKK